MSVNLKLTNFIKFNAALVVAVLAYYLSFRFTNAELYLSDMIKYKDALRPSTLALASLILFSSCFGSYRVKSVASKNSNGHTKTMLIFTQVLGLVFLALLGKEIGYISSLEVPLIASVNFFTNLYYVLMYMFIAQMALAIVLMFMTYFQLELSEGSDANKKLLSLSSSYWNGVVFLWIIVFFLLYLI